MNGCLDVGRWLRDVKAAFVPGLEKVSVARLELYAHRGSGSPQELGADNLELLTSGKKLSKLISLGRGLQQDDAFHLRIKRDCKGRKTEADAWGGDTDLAFAAEAAASAARLQTDVVLSKGSDGHAGYWCEACKAHCCSATAWKQHYGSKQHQRLRGRGPVKCVGGEACPEDANPWSRGMAALAQFPLRRGGTLDVSTKFFDLADSQKALLRLHLDCNLKGKESPICKMYIFAPSQVRDAIVHLG